MWEIRYSSKFKKDLKRYRNQPQKIEKLEIVLKDLRDTGTVQATYRPHMLAGNYIGCMECHIEGDFLLIWIDEQEHTISLVRLGSHSELFK
jgi:mRNA interferase YafQ